MVRRLTESSESQPAFLPLPPLDHFFQAVAVAGGLADGVDELLVVAAWVAAPRLEVALLVDAFHHLVVVAHDEELGQLIPARHHALGVGDALLVEVALPLRG